MNDAIEIPRFRMPQVAITRVATTYNNIVDHVDEEPLAYRERFGQATVRSANLQSGWHILDIGCCAGGTTFAAAERVGPTGHVIGVDIAQDLLALARHKAEARGLCNVEFLCADMTNLDFPDERFDAITSNFSIFYSYDMAGFVAELWRMIKPGGKLAIRTWGLSVFEPLDRWVHDAAALELPDLYRGPTNLDQVKTPEQLRHIMSAAGATNIEVIAERSRNKLPNPQDWWAMAMGSGLRGIINQLTEEGAARVRERVLRAVTEKGAAAVITDTVLGIATKPAKRGDHE